MIYRNEKAEPASPARSATPNAEKGGSMPVILADDRAERTGG
jgi:hypothetical protein